MLVFAFAMLGACGGEEQPPPPASSTGGAGGAGGAGGGGGMTCGTAGTTLDRGLASIVHDDGMEMTNLREQSFTITTTQPYVLNEQVLWEAARFELEHPARVHGFEVAWALPPGMDPAAEIEAGLYGDFGYNGFDFWAPEPLWTGTRCAGEIASGFAVYAFDEPIVVAHPGLVYVAHRAAPGEPVWWFDLSAEVADADAPCALFDECSSALNLPEAELANYYNGISFPFQYDYAVRLYVEYTDAVQREERFFQPLASSLSSGHVSFVDYDEDGWDDLLLGGALYRNDGDGTFSDVTAQAGFTTWATGGVFGDYDGDGCLDVFLFREDYATPDALYRSNCDGTFTDVTQAAGIVDYQTYNDCDDAAHTASPSAAAAWLDYDADGDLDLYVANFNCWADYSFYRDTVFRNEGDGTFVEVTGQDGFSTLATPSRAVAPLDHDRDGDVDLLVGNYVLKGNLFFENQGNGTMLEVGEAVGLAGHDDGGPYGFGHTIGVAWGDLDNDGDFDNVTANLAHPRFFDFSDKTQVLLQDAGSYTDLAGAWLRPVSGAGLRYQETHSVPLLADFDQDGALDLVITSVYDGRPTDFYWGQGDGTFALDAYHAGITTENGWGIAGADFDHDGDLDVFATTLFENQLTNQGHWLQVRAVGTTTSYDGIGATVEVVTGSTRRIRHVQGGTGKGGQDSLYLHFGLGAAATVDEIRVTFPGGDETIYAGPIPADQRLWLFEGSMTPVTSWGKP